MTQDERLKQIRDQAARRVISTAPQWSDIHFLLSLIDTRALVDSQGGDPTAIDYSSALKFVNEWLWNPPAFGSADRSTDQMPWHDPYKQDAAQMVIAASNRAATQMRTACVEKVREVLKPYELEFRRKTNSATNMVDYVAMVLESLTLDQVKQK